MPSLVAWRPLLLVTRSYMKLPHGIPRSHEAFVLEDLFPHWGLRHTSTWTWLKVQALGGPIRSRNRAEKENLVVVNHSLVV